MHVAGQERTFSGSWYLFLVFLTFPECILLVTDYLVRVVNESTPQTVLHSC